MNEPVKSYAPGSPERSVLYQNTDGFIPTNVSPDGRWVAYTSNEFGSWDVFVQAFPGGVSRHQISNRGGSQPILRRSSLSHPSWSSC